MSRKTMRNSRLKTTTLVSASTLAVVLNVVPSTAAIADAMHKSGTEHSFGVPGPNGATSADRDRDKDKHRGPKGDRGERGSQGPQGTQAGVALGALRSLHADAGVTLGALRTLRTRTALGAPVSYTHLTLPTICSV